MTVGEDEQGRSHAAAPKRLRLSRDWKAWVRAAAILAILVVFLRFDIALTQVVIRVQPLGIDFLPIWTGARMAFSHPGELYDFHAVTQAQQWLMGPHSKVRPFIYPPSAAAVFLPFGFIGFWPAYIGLMVASGGVYLAAAWRLSGRWLAMVLLLAAPPVVLSALAGQLSFLVGGLVLWALLLKERPVLAGLLLGAAAAVKPQILILFPLALLIQTQWRMLASAFCTGAVLCLASLPLVGISGWMAWLAALPRFSRLIADDRSLMVNVVTPIGALVRQGVDGPALLAAQAACALIGAAIVWWTFSRKSSPAPQLVALIGGSLLITPYAMSYEFAAFAPAVAALTARQEDRRWPLSFFAMMMLSLMAPGLLALVGVMAGVLLPWRGDGQPAAGLASADGERPELGADEAYGRHHHHDRA